MGADIVRAIGRGLGRAQKFNSQAAKGRIFAAEVVFDGAINWEEKRYPNTRTIIELERAAKLENEALEAEKCGF